MAVKGPTTQRIGSHPKAALGTWRHVDGVFTHQEIAVRILQITPHAMKMDRVSHHGVVDQRDANTLAVLEAQRLGVRELDAIEGPGEFLHVPGKVQLDGATWFATIRVEEGAAQVRVREDASAVVSQTNTWVVQLMRWCHGLHIDQRVVGL